MTNSQKQTEKERAAVRKYALSMDKAKAIDFLMDVLPNHTTRVLCRLDVPVSYGGGKKSKKAARNGTE